MSRVETRLRICSVHVNCTWAEKMGRSSGVHWYHNRIWKPRLLWQLEYICKKQIAFLSFTAHCSCFSSSENPQAGAAVGSAAESGSREGQLESTRTRGAQLLPTEARVTADGHQAARQKGTSLCSCYLNCRHPRHDFPEQFRTSEKQTVHQLVKSRSSFRMLQGLSMVLSKSHLDSDDEDEEPMEVEESLAVKVLPQHRWLLEQLPALSQFSTAKKEACAILRQVGACSFFWQAYKRMQQMP